MTGQVQWNPLQDQEGMTTTLTLVCRPDGSIHMETPQSQGAFSENYSSDQEATQTFGSLIQQGLQQARS